uniref:Uncharacterized protein n=1 Tax=Salix viminalis TaxID=40686 RepID=A0A6N2N332_SALVM
MQGYSQLMAIVPCLTFNLLPWRILSSAVSIKERIMVNPAYYGLENAEVEMLNSYLSSYIYTNFWQISANYI